MSEKIKDRIRKLLNLAKDNDAEHEINNALKFARKLMLLHQINEEDLKQPRDPHEVAAAEEYSDFSQFSETKKIALWEQFLVSAVVKIIGSVGWYMQEGVDFKVGGRVQYNKQGKPIKRTRMTFYGPIVDMNEAIEMYQEWAHVIASMGRLKFGGAFRGSGRSYCEGFAQSLYEKATDIVNSERVKLQSGEATGNELILLSRGSDIMRAKKEQGIRYLAKKGIRLSAGGGANRNSNDSSAFGAGKADGKRSGFGNRNRQKRLNG